MSGVGLVGIAAEGNENVFLNENKNTLFQIRNEDYTIRHFAIYNSGRDVSGPVTVSFDANTEYIVNLPMENDGIGAGFISLQLPEINSTRQEAIAWDKNLVSSILKRAQLRGNKNVVNERTGKQILFEARTKMNTTRFSHFCRLTGMTPNEYYPHILTKTDRYQRQRYPPLLHQTIRTHTPFGHMVDRPVDHIAGQVSTPLVDRDLFLQHVKVSYPDDFFTDNNLYRNNITTDALNSAHLNAMYTQVQGNNTNAIQSYKNEWDVIQAYYHTSNEETTLVNATVDLESLFFKAQNLTIYKHLNQELVQRWLKLWQEYEIQWTNQSFLGVKPEESLFYGTITSFDTTNSPPTFKIYLNEISLGNDVSTTDNVFSDDEYYLFQVIRDTDLYSYPNNTVRIVGQLKDTSTTQPYIQVPSAYLNEVNTTTDVTKIITHLPGQHVGFSNTIVNITSNEDAYAFYSVRVRDATSEGDLNTLGFSSDDTRQLVLYNVTAPLYSIESSPVSVSIPKMFELSVNSTYEDLPIILHDPHERAGRYQPQMQLDFETLRNSFPISWTLNARKYADYSDILSNSTVLANITDLTYDNGNSISYVMQNSISNSTVATNVIDSEIASIEDLIDTYLLSNQDQAYWNSMLSGLSVFRGVQTEFQPDEYGGFRVEYQKSQNYIQAMNHMVVRLGRNEEVKNNLTLLKRTQELFPKIIQQYGNIAYHYHSEYLIPFVEPFYTMLEDSCTLFETTRFFPGTSDRSNTTLASETPQFPADDFLDPTTFPETQHRTILVNRIDYVNATATFSQEMESTYTASGTPTGKFSENYFKLLDVDASNTVESIKTSKEYRFIFWYRVFDFLDKCRLIKELWANRFYNSALSYVENLESLDDLGHSFWVYCIQLYDLCTTLYPSVYDEYRLGAPSLTQQNLAFTRDERIETFTNASVDLIQTSFDINGTNITNSSPYYYHYNNLQFPQSSLGASLSHLRTLPDGTSNITISSKHPFYSILNIVESSNITIPNLTTLNSIDDTTHPLWNILVNTTIELVDDFYFTGETDISLPTRIAMEDSVMSFLYDVDPNSIYMPNTSVLYRHPTKVEGGFFHSTLGSSIGFIVAKEYSTGIPYQGFQTENSEWSNILQYENRIGNLTSDVGPYTSYSLSSSDMISFGLNSSDINTVTFFQDNVSPIVFGFRENIGNPMPVANEPITYRSYNYRIPKYIPQSKWDGCDTSLLAMVQNPLLQYFEYLRINLVHPDDVPTSLVATNYGTIMSQQDDPQIYSHSSDTLSQIATIVNRSNKEVTNTEKQQILTEIGYQEESGAKVTDPITNRLIPAFTLPKIESRLNASRNPIRNEQVLDMNLRLLYRSYISSQNALDSFGAIETPNYIPRHIQDLINRNLIRATQELLADYIVDTTPDSTVPTIVYDEEVIRKREYIIRDIRAILTEFFQIIVRSNIPIENHFSVKTGFDTVWRRWKDGMTKWLRMGVINYVVQELIQIIRLIYNSFTNQLSLNQQSQTKKTEIWLEIMYAMLGIEQTWEIEIDPLQNDDDYFEFLYQRLGSFIMDKIRMNPFLSYRQRILNFKNTVLNLIINI